MATACMLLYIGVDVATWAKVPGQPFGTRMTNGEMTGKDAIDDWQRFASCLSSGTVVLLLAARHLLLLTSWRPANFKLFA